ncbi:MAG: glycoside hydrolase family 127 protein, partial [Planctomycetota bacterium]
MNIRRITRFVMVCGICLGMLVQVCEVQSCSGVSGRKMKKDYPIEPISFTDVKVTDDFWSGRIETNRKVSIPYAFGKCEETGRIDNFAIAGGLKEGEHKGSYPFDDTDAYKILEGASYCLSVHPDAKLDKYLDELIVKIAAAQEDDGYLFTARTNKAQRLVNWYGKERWEKLGGSHELYNMGHLYEAAVAHYQATGKRSLLDVVIKNADFLDTVFGPGKNETAPGHQIIEMGLARLYRATGNEKYLKLAKFYLDTRGPGGNSYHQSHQKVVEQSEAVGHAVRASYMYCGMADVAALTGDESYRKAADRIWDNVVTKKLYLTGGIGAKGSGEAFGDNYELPNGSAYCETCAAIGNVMWNHRMFLFSGEAKYIDVLERTLYNALISGVSLKGDSFFYPNPLESRGQHKRSPWFGCACCPGNITRFIASVPGYVYAQQKDTVYVNLFVDGSTKIKLGKNTVLLNQQTKYPWEGKVKIAVKPERSAKFTIAVRIPGWAQNKPVPSDLYRYQSHSDEEPIFRVGGKRVKVGMHKGYAPLTRKWKKSDVIEIILPMPVRRVLSHKKVADNKGKVALQRGPIVYCAEWPDNDGHVLNLLLEDNAKLTTVHRKGTLNGVTVIKSKAMALSYDKDGKKVVKKEQDFVAIPYYAWAHRGPGEMAVWLASDDSAAKPATAPGMIRNSSFEEAVNKRVANWERRTYRGQGEFNYVEGGRTGKRAVMLSSESGADIGWLTSVPVKPRSKYKLTGWIKTENLEAGSGKGALFNVHNIQPSQTPAVTGTKDWTQVEVVFDTGERAAVEINCLFGGWGLSTGKAWYDDVQLEQLSTKTTKLSVTIDAGETGEPISKFIYGQFIEHLGRCIYGGIWAEMLEDRKFYYPITANYDPYRAASGVSKDNPFAIVGASPWQIVGQADSVTMVKEGSFVGEHTPEIKVLWGGEPSGIRQNALGLVKGKSYTGYIVFAGSGDLKVQVSLVWGTGQNDRQSISLGKPKSKYTKKKFRFKSGATTDDGRLEIIAHGGGNLRVGTVSLM